MPKMTMGASPYLVMAVSRTNQSITMTDAEKAAAEAKAAKQLQQLIRFAAKILNKKPSEIETLAEASDAVSQMIDLHESVISETEQTSFDSALRKVTGETAKALKALGYTDKIEKLDKATLTKIADHFKAKRKPDDDDDDDTDGTGKTNEAEAQRLLKLAKKEIENLKREKAEMETAHAEALEAKDKENAKVNRISSVKSLAEKALSELKAMVPEDQELARKKLDRYLKDIDENDYEHDSKANKWYLLDADGNRVKANGHPVTLDDRLGELVDVHYGRMKADPTKKGGKLPNDKSDDNKRGDDNSGPFEFKAFKGTPPKSRAEVDKYLDDLKTPLDVQNELVAYSKSASLPDTAGDE